MRLTVPLLSARRILLTGGAGFVGGYLAPLLVEAAPSAHRLMLARRMVDNKSEFWDKANIDLLNFSEVDSMIESFRPDLVVHLAAQSSVGLSQGASDLTWRVNFDGTAALARAVARHCPLATFFFTSSSEVYGLSFREGPVDEVSPLQPQNAYGRSKAAAEWMLSDVLSPKNQLIVARAFNHSGPGQNERFVLPSFAAQIARIESERQAPSMIVGNLDAERDFLHVMDVCAAYISLMGAAPRLGARSIFNVTSGRAQSIRSLLEIMKRLSRRPFTIEVDLARLRPGDIPRATGHNFQLTAATSWQPTVSTENMLFALLDYARRLG